MSPSNNYNLFGEIQKIMISNPQTNPVSPRQMPPPHQPQPQQRQTNEPQNSNQG